MSDETAGLGTSIKQLFSPPVITAFRYALTAIGPLFAVVGIVGLSPQQIDKIIGMAQQLGTAAAAIAALIGILLPIMATIWGMISSTFKANMARVRADASGATPAAQEAKQALIASTISLPEVQTIVTDQKTADAAPSESVVAAEAVKVVPK